VEILTVEPHVREKSDVSNELELGREHRLCIGTDAQRLPLVVLAQDEDV
jgi:hypothetical protein